MSEISAAVVETVLDYLCASEPLPAHLISRPLLQRHHFLALSPADGAEYVAWPSVDQSRAVFLLQSEPVPPPEPPLSVHYSADSDYITAHVRITPALRLLFLWDPSTGWQYHNVALMPFPPGSDPSFENAYAIYSPEDFLTEPAYSLDVQADDDSYWNSYGDPDDDADHDPASRHQPQDPNLNSEDAYWAQYSGVQGSGDSTLPSPRPGKDKRYIGADTQDQGRIIIPSDDLQLPRTELYNPLQPPEPGALASRLAALAMHPRSGAASPPLIDDSPTSDTESNTASLQAADASLAPAASSEEFVSQRNSSEFSVVEPALDIDDPADDALRDHVKSLYKLWTLGRPNKPAGQEKELFLSAVKQALGQL